MKFPSGGSRAGHRRAAQAALDIAELDAEAFEAFRETFPDAEEHLTEASDPVVGIHEAALTMEVTAIVSLSRGGSRLVQLLSGDYSLNLVVDPPLPVVSLPARKDEVRN